ncbi:hypothetical protein JYU14_05435 [Simkania negevensis]|uniref:Flagellin n=1 Tax=Simkania negevensis TaxID=83561 RepID=A0ABS3ATG3_9BACT|nr:hypothetical protein [Simkania negevensis]
MIVANNAAFRLFVSKYKTQTNRFQTSMQKISSGERFIVPGEAPADLGISERLRAQVSNAEEAARVSQNAVNMLQSTDTWMQQVNNILDRMSELAIAASDGSKNDGDRTNLNLEFQQLKTEIGRISEAGKYNGLSVNNKVAVSVWDAVDNRIVYSQADGTEEKKLPFIMGSGNTAANGVHYAFETSVQGSVGNFIFSKDGKKLFYIAQQSVASGISGGVTLTAQQTLMQLDINSNTIRTLNLASTGLTTSPGNQISFAIDEIGRIWISNPSAVGGNFNVNLLDSTALQLDSGGTATDDWVGGVNIASGHSQFAVHDNFIYFISDPGTTARQFVKQNIFDRADRQVLIGDLSGLVQYTPRDTYSISQDGQYMAFESNNASGYFLNVVNTETSQKATMRIGDSANSIVALQFDANNQVYWTDTGGTSDANAIKRARIEFGDQPKIENVTTIKESNIGRLGAYSSAIATTNGLGLNVLGGSPGSLYDFQVGPDSGQMVTFTTGDATLVGLGIANTNVQTIKAAQKAISKTQKAIDLVANQRAIIGSEVSRLIYTLAGNTGYADGIAAAESRIRDVDFAQESAELARAQVMAQASTAMLSQFNAFQQNVLSLLQ